jgi:Protein of unknown function (DUF1559)
MNQTSLDPKKPILTRRRILAVSSVGILGCLIALVPAITGARDLPRLSECEHNLKQIGLGLHHYCAAFGSFPLGASPIANQPPVKGLSWQVSVLPYLFCLHCWGLEDFTVLDQSRPWDAEPQRGLANVPLSPMLCTSSPYVPAHGMYSGDHYVDRNKLKNLVPATYIGIAGLGKDAAYLKKGDPKAGVFGYNRVTTLGDITDGTSCTMMVAETSLLHAPWTSGGEATVRGLDETRAPYIGPGRQFGGNHSHSALVLLADGSVRRFRATIPDKVFEALATIAGGETLRPDW